MSKKRTYSTGQPYEELAGFSRALRFDNPKSLICFAGTTSSTPEGKVVYVGDAYSQARYILQIIKEGLETLGASLENVIRTRIYVVDIHQHGNDVARAHKEFFDEIRPAEVMVGVAALAHPDMLVEIEADAAL